MKQENNKINDCICNSKKGETMIPGKYVRFDWAAKTLLRDKANFGVLEGLISVLLNEKVKIEEILESESNRTEVRDKFNRVDVKAKNSKGEIIIVEVQQDSECDFLSRILYGVSKSIIEHISLGEDYGKIKKIYSINILYFNFGKGADYLYHGRTIFTGVNTHDTLQITTKQQNALEIRTPEELFPEYFIIRVNEFDKEARTPLEEWLDYLKNGRIKDDTTTPGLAEARAKLRYMMMSKEEKDRYFRYVDSLTYERSAMESSRADGLYEGMKKGLEQGLEKGLEKGRAEGKAEGLVEGEAKGRAEGRKEGVDRGKAEVALKMLSMGLDVDMISQATDLSPQEIETIRKHLVGDQ